MAESPTERDDEVFPSCGPHTSADTYTYTDEVEVAYVCANVEGIAGGWRQIGRSEPVDGPASD